ncbi:MAG: hypothetical protein QUU85_01255 [Candidatus Eisenbacteria bacterium]|nr:hypothetical protein [Candidatus Eisenbacteria bacterium]
MAWYQEGRWQHRLLAEQELMKSRFPQFRLVQAAGGDLRWIGTLEPVAGQEFLVSLCYPRRYPYESPKLFVEEPRIRSGAPHLYADGSLCVYKQRWDPETSTATSCIPLLAAWLARYVHWLQHQEF